MQESIWKLDRSEVNWVIGGAVFMNLLWLAVGSWQWYDMITSPVLFYLGFVFGRFLRNRQER